MKNINKIGIVVFVVTIITSVITLTMSEDLVSLTSLIFQDHIGWYIFALIILGSEGIYWGIVSNVWKLLFENQTLMTLKSKGISIFISFFLQFIAVGIKSGMVETTVADWIMFVKLLGAGMLIVLFIFLNSLKWKLEDEE